MTFGNFEISINLYRFRHSSDAKLEILGDFLGDDVRKSNVLFFREWALDPLLIKTGGNITSLEKIKNKIVIKYLSFMDDGFEFAISPEKFIALLDSWEKFYKEMPGELILVRYGDTDDVALMTKTDFEKKNYNLVL